MVVRIWIVAAFALAAAGCSPASTGDRRTLTTRQRDSTIARSALPGASVVGRALEQNDGAIERARTFEAIDSLEH